MKHRRRLLWRSKLLLLLLAFGLLPAVAVTVIAFVAMEETSRDATLDGLEALARAKAEAIDQFTDTRRRDVERMAELLSPQVVALQRAEVRRTQQREAAPAPTAPPPQLKDARTIGPDGESRPAAAPPRKTGPAAATGPPEPPVEPDQRPVREAREALSQKLGLLLWDQGTFEELLVMNPAGLVQAATFSDHVGKTAADVEYFDLGRKATYVEPVFRSPITNDLTMVIATPIRDENNAAIGVLAARLNLKRFFRLINDYTGLGKTGETVVVKKIDDQIVFMAPTRHDGDAALSRTIPAHSGAAGARALREAVTGDGGGGVVTDYRGKQVFAAWRPALSLDWGVVTKIDRDEALAPVRAARLRIFGLGLAVALLVLITSLVAARALVRPIGELKDATDKISKGNFDVELNIRSGDEIGELADSFERMVAAIKYFRETSHDRAELAGGTDEGRERVPPELAEENEPV